MSTKVDAHEAETQLADLLARVAVGETITITRQGIPVAVLAPVSGRAITNTDEAICMLRSLRAARTNRGLSMEEIREMRDEGRS